MSKTHPVVGDLACIRFAGSIRHGVVEEITGVGKDKRWVVKSNGRYYPCLTLDKSKMNHIIEHKTPE